MTGGGGGVVEGGHSYILCLVLAVTAAFPMAVHGSAGACTHCTSPAHPHTHTEGQESQSHVLSYCFHRYDSNQRRSHERGTMEGYEEFGFPFKTVSSTARKGKEKKQVQPYGTPMCAAANNEFTCQGETRHLDNPGDCARLNTPPSAAFLN